MCKKLTILGLTDNWCKQLYIISGNYTFNIQLSAPCYNIVFGNDKEKDEEETQKRTEINSIKHKL